LNSTLELMQQYHSVRSDQDKPIAAALLDAERRQQIAAIAGDLP